MGLDLQQDKDSVASRLLRGVAAVNNINWSGFGGWGRWASSQHVLAISDGLGLTAGHRQRCITVAEGCSRGVVNITGLDLVA